MAGARMQQFARCAGCNSPNMLHHVMHAWQQSFNVACMQWAPVLPHLLCTQACKFSASCFSVQTAGPLHHQPVFCSGCDGFAYMTKHKHIRVYGLLYRSPHARMPQLMCMRRANSAHNRTGEGAKKRLEQNQGRLAALRIAILVTTALYIVMRLVIRASTRSGWHWFGLVVTLMAHGASYLAIAAAAQPTYSDTGALLDGGGDLNKGTASAYHDVL